MNRGTAAAVFLALTYIRHEVTKNRDARSVSLPTVLVFPSDHFVYPEDRFLEIVRAAVGAAEMLPKKLVLLGVSADRAEMDYGWIQTGTDLGRFRGHRLNAVTHFKEKPGEPLVPRHVQTADGLWNTLILATNGDLLWSLGRSCFPEMMARLESFAASIGGNDEEANLEALYHDLSSHDLSSELLEALPHSIAVLELNGVLWSDWGRPERIVESLAVIGKSPAFSVSRVATA
jgi:mannose-1-phosphate guanylyltransferase